MPKNNDERLKFRGRFVEGADSNPALSFHQFVQDQQFSDFAKPFSPSLENFSCLEFTEQTLWQCETRAILQQRELEKKEKNVKRIQLDGKKKRTHTQEEGELWDGVSEDIVQSIFSFLTPKELTVVACVCRKFRNVSKQSVLWQPHVRKRWGSSPYLSSLPRIDNNAREQFRWLAQRESFWGKESCLLFHKTLTHNGVVEDVIFFRVDAPNNLLVTISSKGCVRIWDSRTLNLTHTLTHLDDSSSPVPIRLAVANGLVTVAWREGSMRVYDARSGKAHLDVDRLGSRNDGGLWGVFPLPSGLVLACHDNNTCYVVDPQSGESVGNYRFVIDGKPVDETFSLAVEGSQVFTAHKSGAIRSWNVEHGGLLAEFVGHTALCLRVAVLPADENVLISSSHDGTLRLWCLDTGRCVSEVGLGGVGVGLTVGLCGGSCIAVLVKCPTTGVCIQIWSCGERKLKRVRTVMPAALGELNARHPNTSCCFDGLRLMFTRPATALEIVSPLNDLCPLFRQ